MPDILNLIMYVFLFASLNFEVFLLITYFEIRDGIKDEEKMVARAPKRQPSVTIIVPCWNEEKTVSKTINSILNLDYPKDKLKIMVVDDGSIDSTWEVVQKFRNNKQVELYTKENGGKHSALNFGISKLTTDLVGCLDADSYVHKDTMNKIAVYFEDRKTMAVAPSIKLWNPTNPLQLLQKVEYGFGIFTRKVFQYLNAIYITPGPFSIFRKEVFENLGGYRNAHNTEDIELALRMQKNGYKIAHAHNAYVYTVPPRNIKTLLKQRVRWSYGFIKNAQDYKDMFFNRKHGNLGMIILPMAAFSIISILFVSTVSIFQMLQALVNYFIRVQAISWNVHFNFPTFDWFYINTDLIALLGIVTTIGTLTMIILSKKLSEGNKIIGMDLIYFFSLYMFIAPLWIAKASYNVLVGVKATWR